MKNPFCFFFKEQSAVKRTANLDNENDKKVGSEEQWSDIEMEEVVGYETENESDYNCIFSDHFHFKLLIIDQSLGTACLDHWKSAMFHNIPELRLGIIQNLQFYAEPIGS